jgi:uncharacterized membrane protein HdeD (DUF308 family)
MTLWEKLKAFILDADARPSSGGFMPEPGQPYAQFGKRNLDGISWLYPLFNNRLGDLLNLELRHEHLFFIQGDRVLDNVGYSEKGRRFKEEDFGKKIETLDDLQKAGYWLTGRRYRPEVMRRALEIQEDGAYYNLFSNQCQDWVDRLRRNARRVEKEGLDQVPAPAGKRGTVPPRQQLPRQVKEVTDAGTHFMKEVCPTEPGSVVAGIIILLLGVAALLVPALTGQFFGIFMGGIFIVSGVCHGVYALSYRDWRNMLGIIAAAVFYLAAGLCLLINWQFSLVITSFLLATVLAINGVTNVGLAIFSRPLKNWAATLASGLLMLVLAVLLFIEWPFSEQQYFGLLVALGLISGGWSTIYLSWTTRHEDDLADEVRT